MLSVPLPCAPPTAAPTTTPVPPSVIVLLPRTDAPTHLVTELAVPVPVVQAVERSAHEACEKVPAPLLLSAPVTVPGSVAIVRLEASLRVRLPLTTSKINWRPAVNATLEVALRVTSKDALVSRNPRLGDASRLRAVMLGCVVPSATSVEPS